MIKVSDQVPAFMVFFLITGAQIGVGVLGFQSIINKYAGHDAWISVIVAGLGLNIIIWIMYKILNNNDSPETDIVAIHRFTFGKWLGGFFTILFSVYLLFMTVVVLRTYAEIIQVWMFPYIKVWGLLLLIVPLMYYTISGKLRIVTGVCFLGVVYPFFLVFTILIPVKYSHITSILPVFDHSIIEIVQSSSLAILNFLGVATILVFYPFIRESQKSQRFAHYGNLYTTVLYVFICFVSYIYYSQSELENVIWATLGLWKIIELPIMARFEYFGIATLFFSILPNLVLYSWACTRTIHKLFNVSYKKTAAVVLVIVYFASIFFTGREGVNLLNNTIGKVGSVFLFIYIPALFLINFIRRKVKKNAQ
ncbi:GerAB/ArcD/ProY family transporter [Virgibacillus doumboii]|uniref:GerAB/ArcD/ProY family transporter n=1 Tax=Virgibacillus doumboii TaxID=2697503 RepID=UPI0013E0943A|nr:GerAB/ArcD/ProY family transporter [Virgibacillus doumboii]